MSWFSRPDDAGALELLRGIVNGREDLRAKAITELDRLRNTSGVDRGRASLYTVAMSAIEKNDPELLRRATDALSAATPLQAATRTPTDLLSEFTTNPRLAEFKIYAKTLTKNCLLYTSDAADE